MDLYTFIEQRAAQERLLQVEALAADRERVMSVHHLNLQKEKTRQEAKYSMIQSGLSIAGDVVKTLTSPLMTKKGTDVPKTPDLKNAGSNYGELIGSIANKIFGNDTKEDKEAPAFKFKEQHLYIFIVLMVVFILLRR